MREEGQYWTKLDGEWMVSDWDGSDWTVHGSDELFKDREFDEINEYCKIRHAEEIIYIDSDYAKELLISLTTSDIELERDDTIKFRSDLIKTLESMTRKKQ